MIATNNACGCSANGARRSQSTGGSSVLLRVFIVTPLACIFANQDCLHRKYGWVYSLVAHLDTYRSLLFHHSYKISSLLLEFRREKSLNLMHNILKWVCCNYTKRSNYFFFLQRFQLSSQQCYYILVKYNYVFFFFILGRLLNNTENLVCNFKLCLLTFERIYYAFVSLNIFAWCLAGRSA